MLTCGDAAALGLGGTLAVAVGVMEAAAPPLQAHAKRRRRSAPRGLLAPGAVGSGELRDVPAGRGVGVAHAMSRADEQEAQLHSLLLVQ